MFSPSGGGIFRNNETENTGESAIYMSKNANFDGQSHIIFEDNQFGRTYLTDIASSHIEAPGVKNLIIRNNEFRESHKFSLYLVGADQAVVENNSFIDCGRAFTMQYGPFAERYRFNEGQPSVAGKKGRASGFAVIKTGTFNGIGISNQRFSDNRVSDDRADRPRGFLDVMLIGRKAPVGQIKIEATQTEMPLIAFNNHPDVKEGENLIISDAPLS